MWITDSFINYPSRFILIGYAILAMATIILKLETGAITLMESERDLLIWDDEKVKSWDKMRVAEDYLLSGKGSGDVTKALRRSTVKEWNPVIVYFNKNASNLLDKEALIEI